MVWAYILFGKTFYFSSSFLILGKTLVTYRPKSFMALGVRKKVLVLTSLFKGQQRNSIQKAFQTS